MVDRISMPMALLVGGEDIPNTEVIKSSINYTKPDSQKRNGIIEERDYVKDEKNVNYKLFRNIFYENDGEGGVEVMSSPIECNCPAIKNEHRKAYCHMKFNQLNNFIIDKEK